MVNFQKPRGSFNLQFLDGLTHSYRNVQNVVAKLESGTGAKNSLLVNCHFDSVPQSPGEIIFFFFRIIRRLTSQFIKIIFPISHNMKVGCSTIFQSGPYSMLNITVVILMRHSNPELKCFILSMMPSVIWW